jgi:hypothetical protein
MEQNKNPPVFVSKNVLLEVVFGGRMFDEESRHAVREHLVTCARANGKKMHSTKGMSDRQLAIMYLKDEDLNEMLNSAECLSPQNTTNILVFLSLAAMLWMALSSYFQH